MMLEVFYQAATALSILAFLISLVFLVYVISKTKKLNPYVVFSMGTANALVSGKFKVTVLLTLASTFTILIAHFVEVFFESKLFYKIFEISALLLFLFSISLLLISNLKSRS